MGGAIERSTAERSQHSVGRPFSASKTTDHTIWESGWVSFQVFMASPSSVTDRGTIEPVINESRSNWNTYGGISRDAMQTRVAPPTCSDPRCNIGETAIKPG